MSPSSPPKRPSWRRFWRHSFLARVLCLGLSSGVGGFFVGGLIGLSNWISSGPNPFYPWWYWVGFTAPINALWMMFLGFVVGLILFGTGALASSRWSASHKRRFARGTRTRLFLPLIGSLIAFPSLALLAWFVRYRPLTLTSSDVGNVLMNTQIATVVLASCLFSALLVFSSKHRRRKKQVLVERLLPLS